MDVFSGVLRGLQYSVSQMVISIVSICVFRVIWLSTVFKAEPTANNIYMTYPYSWIIATCAFLVCYIIAYKRIKKRLSSTRREEVPTF
jgi:Na+-driven multidrug efflux pump